MSSPLFAGREGHVLPELNTDRKKLEFLLQVKRQVPSLFEEASQYDIDLFTLLDHQRELVGVLKRAHPEQYHQLFKEKRYYDLSITPPREGIPVGSVAIDPQAVLEWKKELHKSVLKLSTETQLSPSKMGSMIRELSAQVRGDDPRRILDQIGTLDRPAPGVGKKPPQPRFEQSKWSALLACKGETGLKHRFECLRSQYTQLRGLPHLPSEEDLNQIVSSLEAEERLGSILELEALALVRSPGSGDQTAQTWDELHSSIDALGVDDLIHLQDKDDVLIPWMDRLFSRSSAHESELEKRTLTALHKKLNTFASKTLSTPVLAKDPIRISQVLPQIGIFRGCTGGDCASRFSFPYPNDPHELVFFIEDLSGPQGMKSGSEGQDKSRLSPEKKIKGYVSATVVDLPTGKKGLYVVTISGKRVSAKDTEVILRALEVKKKELGVDHIVLPSSRHIDSLINFPEIKGVYNSHTQGKEEVRIQYRNPELRAQIEKFKPDSGYNEGSYDHAIHNQEGVILSFKDKKPILPQVDLVVHEDLQLSPQSLSSHPQDEILELLLDFHHSGRSAAVSRVLGVKDLVKKGDEFEGLLDLLQNAEGVSVRELRSKIEKTLSRLESSQIFERKPHFIYPGILCCPDAFSAENMGEVSKLILKDFKEHNYRPLYFRVDSLDERTLERLHQSPSFKSLLAELLKRVRESDPEVRKQVIAVLERVRFQDPDALYVLVEALKDPEWLVRAAAADALAAIKPQDPRVIKALVEALQDSDADVRQKAVNALKEIKPQDPLIHQALVRALQDSFSGVRRSVADAFAEIKPHDPSIHHALVKLLGDPSSGVRRGAVYALEAISRTKRASGQTSPWDQCLSEAMREPLSTERVDQILLLIEDLKYNYPKSE